MLLVSPAAHHTLKNVVKGNITLVACIEWYVKSFKIELHPILLLNDVTPLFLCQKFSRALSYVSPHKDPHIATYVV